LSVLVGTSPLAQAHQGIVGKRARASEPPVVRAIKVGVIRGPHIHVETGLCLPGHAHVANNSLGKRF
jgi:hypothetical protein